MHVHVGRQDGAPFSLTSLKKLATLLWLTEPVLRSIRNPRSPNFRNVFTWGAEVRQNSRLGSALLRGEDPKPLCTGSRDDFDRYVGTTCAVPEVNKAVKTIWRAGSLLELGRLLSGPERQFRRLGFNFSAFGEEDERSRTGPKTVEFRVLEGTLRDELIAGWLQICCKLVELAMAERQGEFLPFVKHQYKEVESSVISLRGDVMAPDRAFGNLMEQIGVDASAYEPLQAKIRQNYDL